ncbi:MAG TPA: type II secretion system protein [Candidatus Acidoferrales bacterium]|jgi:prepilin-type N-terminal cleavage/methylation domain-containing protein|nr:type II secretion system protein [Candidatus Acidoferrales bacterium]
MKLLTAIPPVDTRATRAGESRYSSRIPHLASRITRHREQGFTMIEIAICLAIIGVALVGIIGVLPYGMNTQRDNREETVIGQDASLLVELIRNGARGADDLTNYVIAITNYQVAFATNAVAGAANTLGWDSISGTASKLTSGAKIIGLLSTPEFVDLNYQPTNNLFSGGYSNHIVAYVRSMSGLAAEKPPQDNQIMRDDTFTYRLFILNAPLAQDTNNNAQAYNRHLDASFHDLRLSYTWPVLPTRNVGGGGPRNFRTSVAGQVEHQFINSVDYYYYHPQTFSTAP